MKVTHASEVALMLNDIRVIAPITYSTRFFIGSPLVFCSEEQIFKKLNHDFPFAKLCSFYKVSLKKLLFCQRDL